MSSRLRLPPKKRGNASKQVTYDTYGDAMEGGIEHEEKGEKFRAGEKVRRGPGVTLGIQVNAHVVIPGTTILRKKLGTLQVGLHDATDVRCGIQRVRRNRW